MRRRPRTEEIIGLLLLSCCGLDLRFVELPESDAASFLAIVDEGARSWFLAFSSQDPELFLSHHSSTSVTLAAYPQSLPELGLSPGIFQVLPEGQPCAIGRPDTSFIREVAEDHWSQMDAFPEAVRAQLIPDFKEACTPCAKEFDETRVFIDDDGFSNPLGLIPLASGAVAVSTQRSVFWVDRSDFRRLADCPAPFDLSVPLETPNRFLTYNAMDHIFEVQIVEEEYRCEVLRQIPMPQNAYFRWMNGSPRDPLELFALTSTGTLWRFDDDWTLVASVPEGPPDNSDLGGVVWLSPGRVVASAGARDIIWWTDGTIRDDQVPGGFGLRGEGLSELIWVPGLGLAAGLASGDVLFTNGPGGWAQLPGRTSNLEAISVRAFRDGLVVFDREGGVQPGALDGMCETTALVAATELRPFEVVTFPDDTIVIPDIAELTGRVVTELVWLRPRIPRR